MKKITKKIRDKIVEKLTPLVEQMQKEGMSNNDINRTIKLYRDCKVKDFYNSKKNEMSSINTTMGHVLRDLPKADSKIEDVFYNALSVNNIPFDFQVKIGPYRVDYLIGGVIVFEGDGPQHELTKDYDNKRDKYFKDMGYLVFRMRWDHVAMACGAVLEEIDIALNKHKKKKIKK